MGILILSDERHHRLQRFRRRTWLTIALCAALRLADSALGFGLIEPAPSLAAQEAPVSAIHQDFTI